MKNESCTEPVEQLANSRNPAVLLWLLNHKQVSPTAKPRLRKMLTILQAGEILTGTDPVYLRGVLMALYASSSQTEETIFRIRYALIQRRGNVTEAAKLLNMYRTDVVAYMDDYPEVFRDLTQTGRPDPKLLDTLSWKAETDSMVRALEVTKGSKKSAASVLGINRTTLIERLKKLGIDATGNS